MTSRMSNLSNSAEGVALEYQLPFTNYHGEYGMPCRKRCLIYEEPFLNTAMTFSPGKNTAPNK